MGFDDVEQQGNLTLVLGLGFKAAQESVPPNSSKLDGNSNNQRPKKTSVTNFSLSASNFEPSLTLGPSGTESHHHHHHNHNQVVGSCRSSKIDVNKGCEESNIDLYRQASPHSAVSSFSSGRVKRERDLSSEEIEVEKVSSRVSDEDEDGSNARKKLRLTKEQSALLEESFKQHSTLNPVSTLSLSL